MRRILITITLFILLICGNLLAQQIPGAGRNTVSANAGSTYSNYHSHQPGDPNHYCGFAPARPANSHRCQRTGQPGYSHRPAYPHFG